MAIWKNYEVDEGKKYYVALIQDPDGGRTYELVEKGHQPKSNHAVLKTEIVPYQLLFWRRMKEISETVVLTNGEHFCVDAHNVWFTNKEAEALNEDDEGYIPWLNNKPPLLAPR